MRQEPDADGVSGAVAEDGAAGRSKGSRVLLTVGVAVTVTLAAAGFALGRNVSASRAQTHPGSAWLTTTADGSVNLVDGVSGGSAAKVPVPNASGHSMDVTQNGDLVFVRDTVTGAITVIDTSQLVATVQVPHSKDTTVLAGGGVAYLVDAIAGTVQKVDPATLAPVGAQVHLPGALGTPIVDHNGVLWAPVTAQGSVIAVTGDTQAAPIAVDPNGSDMVMALAGGTPTVVDRTAGTLTAITGGVAGQVIKLPGAANSGTGLQVASVDSNQPLPLVESGPTAQLVLVNLASGIPTSIGIPAGYTADDLRPPLQAGQRTYIPDFTRGSVLVYDGTTNRFGTPVPVLAHGGSFQSEIVDGIVYFNDPSSGTAVSVSTDGAVHTITKNGSTIPTAGPSTTQANPNPSPTQPPTTHPSSQNHDTSAPPVTETSTANEPSAPPTTKPVVPTSPIGPPSNSVPIPASSSSSKPSPTPTPTPTSSASLTKQPPPPPSTSKSSTPAPPPSTTSSSTPAPVAPQAPQAVTVTPNSANNGSVTVKWKSPGNASNIASYKVTVNNNAGVQSTVKGDPLALTVSKLTCGPSYSFTVTSVGPTGLTKSAGAVSSRACFSPGSPTSLNVTTPSGSANSLAVKWSKPTNPGIGTLTYSVTLTGPSAPTAARSVTGTSTTFTSLVPGRSYTVSVQAVTNGGKSTAVKGTAVAGGGTGLTVNLNAVKGYYAWAKSKGIISCTYPQCPTWIQRTPSTYDDTSAHGSWVTTATINERLTGYCYNGSGYSAEDDSKTVHSSIWIYVNAGGHFGYASSLWFGDNASTHSLPACPGSPPVG
ncbi:fibronectin type III domain-containing protein [Catenulispora acidiphila]|uniref:fibronectin type III domain-containing protein n=1 Tax=Catenulispora acidiphila TaxID=304895 RepID=UPI00019DE8B6|nr:fibronectin type III domain-containing protein [Catenulispora acidiphila]